MTPDAAERRARAALEATRDRRECGSCGVVDPPTDGGDFHVECPKAHPMLGTCAVTTSYHLLTREMSDALARDVLSLADALRAAEARAVAAEASLRSTGDSALRITTQLGAAMRERDAADARCAALAGAVRAEREAESALSEALAATNRAPLFNPGERIERYEAFCAAERVYVAAHERTDALLRGAPGGYVPVGVVRAHLDAADASRRIAGEPYDALDDGAIDDWRARHGAASKAKVAARTALDAALLAATTTPTEGHRP